MVWILNASNCNLNDFLTVNFSREAKKKKKKKIRDVRRCMPLSSSQMCFQNPYLTPIANINVCHYLAFWPETSRIFQALMPYL